MKVNGGAEIKSIFRITRDEPSQEYLENTDFSIETIRNSIKDGDSKANQILEKIS